MKRIFPLVGCLLLGLLADLGLQAATLRVPQEFATIQQAVDAAKDGDEVVLARGEHIGADLGSKYITIRSDYLGESPTADDIANTVIRPRSQAFQYAFQMPKRTGSESPVKLIGITLRGSGLGNGIQHSPTDQNGRIELEGVILENWQNGMFLRHCQRLQIKRSIARNNIDAGFWVLDTDGGEFLLMEECLSEKNGTGFLGYWANGSINRSVFRGNQTGMRVDAANIGLSIKNSEVSKNQNGLLITWGIAQIENCTIADNKNYGIQYENGNSAAYVFTVSVLNSIIFGNGVGVRENNISYGSSIGGLENGEKHISFDFCLLQGSSDDYRFSDSLIHAINYFGVNPQFASASSGNYHLTDRSLAIGAGRATISGLQPARESDPINSNVDLGAHENPLAFPVQSGLGVAAQVTPEVCPGSNSGAIRIATFGFGGSPQLVWSGPNGFRATTANLEGLATGIYTVIAEGAGSKVTNSFEVWNRHISASVRECGSVPNTTLRVLAKGGFGMLAIRWADGNQAWERSIATSGEYRYTISDEVGCTFSGIVKVGDGRLSRFICVDSKAKPDGDGSREKPYRVLQEAIWESCDGDTIILARGEHIGADLGSKYITIRSDYLGESPTADDIANTVIRPRSQAFQYAFQMPKRTGSESPVKLIGITLRGSGLGNGIQHSPTDQNGRIELEGVILENWQNGMFLRHCQRLQIKRSIARNNIDAGFWVLDTDGGEFLLMEECLSEKNGTGFLGYWANGSINRSVFRGNQTGMRVDAANIGLSIKNSEVSKNQNGLLITWGIAQIENCTIADNKNYGIQYENGNSAAYVFTVSVLNSIIFGNGVGVRENNISYGSSIGGLENGEKHISFDFCLLQGSSDDYRFSDSLIHAINYFGVNPQFASASSGNYHLTDRSLAIGAGRATISGLQPARESDPINSNVDLGAHENPLAFPVQSGPGVAAQVTPEVCPGSNSGAIRIATFGFGGSPQLVWSGPNGFRATTANLEGLATGIYTVIAEGAGSKVTNSFEVWNRHISASVRECGSVPNITLRVLAKGGFGMLAIRWADGNQAWERSIATSGEYRYTISDEVGCTFSGIVKVGDGRLSRFICVDSKAKPDGDGSREKPYRVLQEAIWESCDGDTIILARGEHIGADLGSKYITIRSDYLGESPTADDIANTVIRPRSQAFQYAFQMPKRTGSESPVKLIGITLRGSGLGNGIQHSPTDQNGRIELEGVILENWQNGMFLRHCQRLQIKRSIARNNIDAGFWVLDTDGGEFLLMEECLSEKNGTGFLGYWANGSINRSVFRGNQTGVKVDAAIIGLSVKNTETSNNLEGVVSRYDSKLILENCTVAGNRGNASGGGAFGERGLVEKRNCIIYGNKGSNPPSMAFELLVDDLTDPKFISPSTGDFRLRDDSPAINAGDNSVVTDPNATDLDGRKRILGGRVDLGAYERWTFYSERTLTVAEGATGSLDPSAEDLTFFGGVTFLKESGPDGVSVEPSTGRLTWAPTEAQGPGTYTAVIRGTVSNNPSATDTQTLTLVAQEVNRAPEWGVVGPQRVEERKPWTLTLPATDPDLPVQKLSYKLITGPVGMTVNATNGWVAWTPGEADGGKTLDLVFEVADGGTPPLSAQTTVRLEVIKVNHPPVLAAIADVTIPEGSPWTLRANGTDDDLPVQTVAYALPVHPDGMTVDAATGVLQWTPGEGQGPGTYPVTVRVTDPEGLTAERAFQVTVTEVNRGPEWTPIPDAILVPGKTLSLTLQATDADVPANPLSYRLVRGPSNVVVTAQGQLTWTPVRAQAPSTNRIEVAVSDGSLSVTNGFTVEVVDLVTVVNGVVATHTVGSLPPVQFALQHSKDDWLVFYSLDGTEPTASSFFYLEPQRLEGSSTVWPILFKPDFSASVLGLPVRVNVWQEQTLTVTGGEGLVHQGAGVAIAGTASSGLPVTLEVVSGPGRLENGRLVPKGGGTIRLRVSQAGDEVWAPISVEVERVVAPAAQTVTWSPVDEATFGDAPLALKASASSGLPVTFSVVSGPGTVQGDRLTLTGAGGIVVRAEQAGSADFKSARGETTVTVLKASQSLTFAALSNRTFTTNGIPLVGNASSGLPVAFEVLTGPAKVMGTQLFLNGVGTVVVRASQLGTANYHSALPKDQTFTVTQGTQTLTFSPVGAKTFGDAPVTLVATSSSGLPVTFRVLSGPGIVSGEVLTLTGAGSVLVQATQAGDVRYQAANASQTVVVGKASQTLTFPVLANRGYTTNAIPLEATASSGLPVGYRIISGAATVNGAELRLTGVGTVAVAAEQAGTANYLAAPSRTNTFTVSRGVQTITFQPVGEPVLGSGPVALMATSSAGLPVTFSVLSGPATVSGSSLTLLNEGAVTVRALNPGSPLWLAAQVDQTFQIRKLTTLTLSPVTGGTITVDPVKERYDPKDVVTLSAVSGEGYRFEGWSGDLTGTVTPTTLVMAANRNVGASFKDVAAPVLTWDLPVAGTTGNERAVLSGRVTDNAAGVTATWRRGGGAAETLALAADGSFRVEGLRLVSGANAFVVTAQDAAGNTTTLERSVTWVPERTLRVANATEVQEGQRLVFPVQLVADAANVAGLTFRLSYDPTSLTDPQVEWGALVGQSVNNVNVGTAGEISGSFALAGTALPAGTNPVATVSFRARSVPGALTASLTPRIESLSSPSGAALSTGNAEVSGEGRILPRKIRGDNNANQRIDVGDAVVISRLQVKLEEVRPWDVALNDLNDTKTIDSGDVVKALRFVVGLDAQPKAMPRSGGELSVEGGVLRGEAGGADAPEAVSGTGGTPGSVSQLSTLNSQRRFLRPAGSNTNDVATLEFPDGPVATAGKPYRVVVKLTRAGAAIAGLSFTVNYPTALTLTDKQVGALVPSDALPLWAESTGSVNLAAVRSTIWPTSTGVAAVLTFLPTAGINGQATWPIELVKGEVTGAGFDIRALDDVRGEIRSTSTPPIEPKVVVPTLTSDGGPLSLDIEAAAGAAIVLETTTDLGSWSEAQRLTGQGAGKPVRVTVTPDPNARVRFWRVRVP